jgi:hypothetical protein
MLTIRLADLPGLVHAYQSSVEQEFEAGGSVATPELSSE